MKTTKFIALSAIVLTTLVNVAPALAAEDKTYTSNGIVEFVPSTDPTLPVDPTDPDPTNPVVPIDPTDPEGPEPGTNGPLSIDYASSLDFGKNKIINKDEVYYANAQELTNGKFVPNYVQVSDNRGTNTGWALTVKQEGQFENKTTQHKVLTGSVIKLSNGVAASNQIDVTAPLSPSIELDASGAASNVMTAANETGSGTWVDRFGTVTAEEVEGETVQKNKAISLEVPGSTPKDAVKYSTQLTWTLTDTPINE
ncbi:WxL domain-containing protein [Carnobacterium maltaromaticum]|uniref:WxL domain-containing protein n=1 Tax=Carnobacterium maltaromaticum TaxID=2751 RepID=UPI0039BE00B2